MGTNLKQFNAALKKASKKFIGENIVKFHKAVVLEAFTRIVKRTPVDTGRARGNWQLGINTSSNTILDVKIKDEETALRIGLQALTSITPFSIVHITNNLEYIYYLEYVRTSEQHPEGMVEVTIAELKAWVQKL